MDSDQSEPLDESCFRDPQWIAMNNGHLHSNNVLFYFAESPFFDRQSNNNSVFLQAVSDPRFRSWIDNRQNFEAQLRRIAGMEYVVVLDPVTGGGTRDATGDFSKVWSIQKQTRRKRPGREDDVTPLAMYYIVGDVIYQAPTTAKMIGNRVLSTVTSLNKLFSIGATLPIFSAAHGHTYIPPSEKPRSKPTELSQSREHTPMPSSQRSTGANNPASSNDLNSWEDTRLFIDSRALTRRHGNHYMDEAPLAGEPGNFRIAKLREAAPMPKELTVSERQGSIPVKEKSKAPSLPPTIQTNVPAVESKKSAKGGDKSRRRQAGRRKRQSGERVGQEEHRTSRKLHEVEAS